MCRTWIIFGIFAALFANMQSLDSQTSAAADQSMQPMKLNVSVDEVSLTFHAEDGLGVPVTDLQVSDLTIYDNYKTPRKVLVFRSLQNIPLRVGILLDTSESMQDSISRSRAIATEYVRRLLRPETDRAFSEEFGYVSRITQSWTGNANALAEGIAKATPGKDNPLGGTALFDTLYKACLYQFAKSDQPTSGNVILLFTDGEDNAGHVDLRRVIDVCQQANTSIYAFGPQSTKRSSTGPRNLALLTSQTGGRVFHLNDTDAETYKDLSMIDAALRNQYWLVYRPAELKHDGRFHSIYVGTSDSSNSVTIEVRAGYYAPVH